MKPRCPTHDAELVYIGGFSRVTGDPLLECVSGCKGSVCKRVRISKENASYFPKRVATKWLEENGE